MTGEEPPQAGKALLQTVGRLQPGVNFRERQVRLGPDQIQQPVLVDLHGL